MGNVDWKKGTDAASTAYNANQAAEQIKSLTAQANATKGVTGDQVRALRASIDTYTQLGGFELNGKSIDGALDDLAKMADAEQSGKPLSGSDQKWADDMAFLTDAANQIAQYTGEGAAALANPVPSATTSGTSAASNSAAGSSDGSKTLQKAVGDAKSPWSDDELAKNAAAAGFTGADGTQKYAMQLITRDVMAGASPAQMAQDMRIAYQAYSNVARNGTNINGSVNDFAANLESAINSGKGANNGPAVADALDAVKNWHAALLKSPVQTQDLTYQPKDYGAHNIIA